MLRAREYPVRWAGIKRSEYQAVQPPHIPPTQLKKDNESVEQSDEFAFSTEFYAFGLGTSRYEWLDDPRDPGTTSYCHLAFWKIRVTQS